MENNKNLDKILYENSSVYVLKSHSFDIMNIEINEACENLFVNKSAIVITSR